MKITVTTTATSFYNLAITWLVANNSMTIQEAQAWLQWIQDSKVMQADFYVASWTVYYDRGLNATTTTSIPIGAGITRLSVESTTDLSLVSTSNTDVLVAIEWIF